MFKDMFTLDSTQLVINVLSILAFFMSAFLSASKFLSSRRNIGITIHDYSSPMGTVQFFVNFQNNSSTGISIHLISVIANGKERQCELLPKMIRKENSEIFKTTSFPIFLSPEQGYLCFLEFLHCQDIQLSPGKTVDFRIYSNRVVINKSVTLGNTSHYLHIRR